jgi:tRNA(fMet)-specific endonuclease VapC
MILLDTDHLSVLTDGRHRFQSRLLRRLKNAEDLVVVPIVAVEEQLRGWLAKIHRVPRPHDQIVPYLRLAKLIDFLRDWQIVDWNEPSADVFAHLRSQRIRIGTQDLKIAALALANDALLLSANLRDFNQVPQLRVEDWLTEPNRRS